MNNDKGNENMNHCGEFDDVAVDNDPLVNLEGNFNNRAKQKP